MPLMTGVSDALSVTTIAKLLRLALEVPSLTTMVMFEYVPTCAELGVPDSSPVDVLKVLYRRRRWRSAEKRNSVPQSPPWQERRQ